MPEFQPNLWHTHEEIVVEDQISWQQQERTFFQEHTRPKTKAQAKRKTKNPKAPKTVVTERTGAYNFFRGLDHALFTVLGAGLAAYLNSAPGFCNPLANRPLLVLHYDECSSNISLYSWLLYAKNCVRSELETYSIVNGMMSS